MKPKFPEVNSFIFFILFIFYIFWLLDKFVATEKFCTECPLGRVVGVPEHCCRAPWPCRVHVAARAVRLSYALCACRAHCRPSQDFLWWPVLSPLKILCYDIKYPFPGKLCRDIDWPCRDILSPCLGKLCCYRKSLAWPTLSRHEMFCRDKTTSALDLNSIAIEPCLAVCRYKDFSIATGLCRAPRCHR